MQGHLFGDERSPIAALRDIPIVAEALHQHDPRPRDALRIPAGFRRLAGKAVARHRRDHDVERVRFGAAMRGGVGERIDDLQLLDDRTGPAVRDDHRQRILMLRLHVDEVDVEAVDLGDEVRQRLQMRLALAPIVFRSPVLDELLHRGELHALCCRLPPGSTRSAGKLRRTPARARAIAWRLMRRRSSSISSCREADGEGADRTGFGRGRRLSRGEVERGSACRSGKQCGCRSGKKVAPIWRR